MIDYAKINKSTTDIKLLNANTREKREIVKIQNAILAKVKMLRLRIDINWIILHSNTSMPILDYLTYIISCLLLM
jgi:hypothetical protein